ncbi:hypothetical protein M413DRAFT_444692 [Hebeloma cylindrosporum]|uniref:30S ribosomal protein S15 n=1 Tax=Hebeloma cylindrosporum TaxID=76867 RepID=A0A0C2XX85_HEBCY|nr:hypothetical protein M413DRAFT_444692 [Hebeloma cylindrosporum h7]
MFRTCVSSGSRVASSSTTTYTASLHTSAVLNASKKSGLRTKKINLANTAKRLQEAAAVRPSVVLGTRPHEEAEKWPNCDLAKVIINEADLHSTTAMNPKEFSIGTVDLPKEFAFGVDPDAQKLLFEELPAVAAQMNVNSLPQSDTGKAEKVERLNEDERLKANLLAKALDLRNANAAGIAFENRRRIIQAFSTPENPYNTGRTEVQVALLTFQIRNLWDHLLKSKRDVASRRSLRMLIHQRAKLLRYLRGKDRDRYETILDRLALEPESVEGELVV